MPQTARTLRLLLTTTLLSALACSTAPPSGLRPIQGFEPDRYLGTWYEIARLDHPFERGLEDISAHYSRRDDGGLRVRNRGYDPEDGEWREAVGKAYFIGAPEQASLKVSFFGPFYGGYHVIALDEEGYRDALVTGPSRDYLWILARDRALTPERRDELVAFAERAGFDTDALIWVNQNREDPVLRASPSEGAAS